MNEAFKNDLNAESDLNAENDFNSKGADNLSETIAYVETPESETAANRYEGAINVTSTAVETVAQQPYEAQKQIYRDEVSTDKRQFESEKRFEDENRYSQAYQDNHHSNGNNNGGATPPKKHRSFNFKTVLSFVLILTLIGGSTYSIGYYQGQISLNESAIETSVQQILSKNIDSEIYRSVQRQMLLRFMQTSAIQWLALPVN
jgi:hypothetical protein